MQEWTTKMLDTLRALNIDAILSPVLECCAPPHDSFELAPCPLMPGIMNFLHFPAGSVPFGRVTEEDEKQHY